MLLFLPLLFFAISMQPQLCGSQLAATKSQQESLALLQIFSQPDVFARYCHLCNLDKEKETPRSQFAASQEQMHYGGTSNTKLEIAADIDLFTTYCCLNGIEYLELAAPTILAGRAQEASQPEASQSYSWPKFDHHPAPPSLRDTMKTIWINDLIQNGTNPNKRDEEGTPALIAAIQLKRADLASSLIEAEGIDILATNAHSQTALQVATALELGEIIQALEVHAALIEKINKN